MAVEPANLSIRIYPDPVLKCRAEPIETTGDEHRRVADRMIELMYEARGIGLAAPQIGLSWRLFVCDVPPVGDGADPSSFTSGPEIYVNPVLSQPNAELEAGDEGCLSLPDISGDVRRPTEITMQAINLDGKSIEQRASGMLARCWQHEVDHLDGVLILDRMTQMSRLRVRSAVRSLEKAAGVR